MKMSIRFSILSILLGLLIGITLITTSINYFTLDKILIKTTQNAIEDAGDGAGAQVAKYLQPLNTLSYLSAKLIADNAVTPEPSLVFMNFLNSIIKDNVAIVSSYWADPNGNFYRLEKNTTVNSATNLAETLLINVNIIRDTSGAKTIETMYDSKLNLLNSKESDIAAWNPTLRPWYQRTKLNKQPAWLVYPLIFTYGKKSELGITATYPVYDQAKQLRGILGIDMPLNFISEFVKQIKVTKNSLIFICNEQEHLITAYSANINLLEGYRMPRLEDLEFPWAKQSFMLYQKTRAPVFIYSHNHKKYVAAYRKISGLEVGTEWNIAIVTPYQDVVAPLQRSIFMSFIFVFFSLGFGVVLAIVFSLHISKPIIKLAQDAELICQLRLPEVQQLYSNIKEIGYMADNFMKMKSVLSSFQRYMPIALVKKLLASGKIAEVGGETKDITLLFTDIASFTSISEKMPPQEVMQYLSEYFQAITKIIMATSGTVDKYIGDGLMAFWGAPIDDPKHALYACRAAIRIQAAFAELNSKWQQAGKPIATTRIGVNTGQVIIGNVGSDDRLSYTALGDEVNLASRLENLNKEYKTCILVGENTYQATKESFKFRLMDKVAVKGKIQGIYVYELLGENTNSSDLQLELYNQSFKQAFAMYEQGKWAEALQLFTQLASNNPQDRLLPVFMVRCQDFAQKSPDNWSGVWTMDHK